jgi:SAM-dependent methyltransferase
MKEVIISLIPRFILKAFRNYQERHKLEIYKGDKVFCPICNLKFKKFGPFGVEKRLNARCVNCGSLERHRLIYLYLKNQTNVFDPNVKIKMLHFAPEGCLYDVLSQKENIDYIVGDIDPDFYNNKLKGSIKVQKLDITDIDFEDNYFDVILCSHILEHIPDDKRAMSELYRVMKKDGWGIIQIPIDYKRATTYEDFTITTPRGREKAFGRFDHVRWYGRDFKDKLTNAGFDIKEEDLYIKSFSTEEVIHYGLQEKIYTIIIKK